MVFEFFRTRGTPFLAVAVAVAVGFGVLVASGPSARGEDCNGNRMLDEAEILLGQSADCNGNDRPDECDTAFLAVAAGFSLGGEGNTRSRLYADFDGDDVPDLGVGTSAGAFFWLSSPDGSLAGRDGGSLRLEGVSRAWASGNLDGDENTDLVALQAAEALVLRGRGDASFGPPEPVGLREVGVQALALGDLDGSGADDLVVTNRDLDRVRVVLNRGDGTFDRSMDYPVGDFPVWASVSDLNGDGDLDVVVVNRDSSSLSLLDNAGDGTFAEPHTLDLDTGVTDTVRLELLKPVDLDGDSSLDIVAAHWEGLIHLRNRGDGTFFEPRHFLYERPRRPSAIESGDLDGDGDLDIVVGDSGQRGIVAFWNDGGIVAANQLPVQISPGTLLLTDGDQDGDLDYVITPSNGPGVVVFWNAEGEETFNVSFSEAAHYPVGGEPHGATSADVDGDGSIDVITANNSGVDGVSVLLNQGDGSFAEPVLYSPPGVIFSVATGDVDGDGDLDLLAGDRRDARVHVLENPGDGTFGRARSTSVTGDPFHLATGDLDGDGTSDVISTSSNGQVELLRQYADGAFASRESAPVGVSPRASVPVDLDGDADPDVAVANLTTESITVLWNDGAGGFAESQTISLFDGPNFIAAGDFDADGRNDLAVTVAGRQSVVVLWNDGDRGFDLRSTLPLRQSPFSLIAGDLDGNGVPDLIAANATDHNLSLVLSAGQRQFSLPLTQTVRGGGPRFVVGADFDGRGAFDLISANHDTRNLSVLHSERPTFEGKEFLERLCTMGDYYSLSSPLRGESPFARTVRYTVPARTDLELLPTIFQNSDRFVRHGDFFREVFPDRFGELSSEELDALVAQRASRDYFVGEITRVQRDGGFTYAFTVVADTSSGPAEALREDEVIVVYAALSDVFDPGPLEYFPDTEAARREASTWPNPPFPIFTGDLRPGVAYEAYTTGLGYGRIRLLTLDEFHEGSRDGRFTFQDILVIDDAPRDVQGVVGGIVTGAPQGPASYVAIRSARRGTPDAFVAEVREEFGRYEGKLVRLEVLAEDYVVTPVEVAEAEVFWAASLRELSVSPTLDEEYAELDELLEMDLSSAGGIAPEARYGGKASHFARLQRVLTGDLESFQERAFVIPMRYYREFMQGNTLTESGVTLTYEEYLALILQSPEFQSDSRVRFDELARFRELLRQDGVVSTSLVERVVERMGAVFGGPEVKLRFRASSNAEVALEFSGAGLYESTSGCAADTLDDDDRGPSLCALELQDERSVERALKKVWSSLWTFRAHEERAYYQIPPENVGMAILVSRAFVGELANGIAFAGNPLDDHDARYLVIVQVGEASVVDPEPGTLLEHDLLDVVDGQVVQIFRDRQSSLRPPGESVLSDAQLRELGALMWRVDQDLQLELGDFDREEVLLDFEFKVESGGTLAVKQLRPSLRAVPARTPTFELHVPPGTTVCGVFSKDRVGRSPQTEYETKTQIRFVSGVHELSTRSATFAADLIEEVLFGPEQAPADAVGAGLFRTVKLPAGTGRTIHRFTYEQEFRLAGGERYDVRLFNLNYTDIAGVPLTPALTLDDAFLTFDLPMEGTLDGTPVASYASCSYDLLPHWEVEATFAEGSRLWLDQRFEPSENLLSTGPAAILEARVLLDGQEQVVTDYWRLVYAARRHNRGARYWVVLDPPLALQGLERPVKVVELTAAEPFDQTREAVAYLDSDFRVLHVPEIDSYRFDEVDRPPETSFRRGDVTGDATLNLVDVVRVARFLFAGGGELPCVKAADFDDSGSLSLLDPLAMVRFLFMDGAMPAEPFAGCGGDPTPDPLSCQEFASCAGP